MAEWRLAYPSTLDTRVGHVYERFCTRWVSCHYKRAAYLPRCAIVDVAKSLSGGWGVRTPCRSGRDAYLYSAVAASGGNGVFGDRARGAQISLGTRSRRKPRKHRCGVDSFHWTQVVRGHCVGVEWALTPSMRTCCCSLNLGMSHSEVGQLDPTRSGNTKVLGVVATRSLFNLLAKHHCRSWRALNVRAVRVQLCCAALLFVAHTGLLLAGLGCRLSSNHARVQEKRPPRAEKEKPWDFAKGKGGICTFQVRSASASRKIGEVAA